MRPRPARLLPPVLAALGLSLVVAGVAMAAAAGPPESWSQFVAAVASAGALISVGAMVSTKRPRNPAGWLLQASGLYGALVTFDLGYVGAGASGAALVEWLTSVLSVPALTGTVVFLLLTFPNGPRTASRWKIVALGWTTGAVLFTLGNAFSPELLDDAGFANPFAVGGGGHQPLLLDVCALSGAVLIASAIVAAVVSVVLRFRRARGVERQQMKWFVAATIVVFVSGVSTAILYEGGRPELANTITALSSIGFPVAIGIAILRYRLYEIDRIINRTVVYAVVVGALAAVFAGGVSLASSVLPTGSGNLGVAGSTLAVAALFNPLRRRVQSAVDRRFNRSRYDANRIADEFSTKLRNLVEPVAVGTQWADVVTTTMQPATIAVWVKDTPSAPAL